MDIKDKDFQKNFECLNKYFEQLSLQYEQNHHVESDNGECTEDCIYCKNKPSIFDLASDIAITESDFKIIVNDDNINTLESISKKVSLTEEKVPLDLINEAENNNDVLLKEGKVPLVFLKKEENNDNVEFNEEKIRFDFIKEEKIDDDLVLNERKIPLDFLKKEEIDDTEFNKANVPLIKKEEIDNDTESEESTDFSSSDDEHLIERSGKEGTKKRRHRRREYAPRIRVSREEIERERRLHCSAGFILENNSITYCRCQTCLTARSNYNVTFNNESHHILNVHSPESGYESYSSVHSPSPPVVDSTLTSNNDFQEEVKKKMEIYNSILDLEKRVHQSSMLHQNSTGNFITTTNFQACTDENSILNNLVELFDTQINQSAMESNSNGLEVNESNANQKTRFGSTSIELDESCKRKISYNIKDDAKKALRSSLNNEKYRAEEAEMIRKCSSQKKENMRVITYDEREIHMNLQRTNLHTAVIESNMERVYCIIETLKLYKLDLFHINDKDMEKKTALDYAVKQGMPLLVNYLIENNAVQAEKCCIK